MIEESLVARAARGDRQAVEQLCRQSWRQLYAFVYQKVQNREEAEDVTQETYIRVLRALPRYGSIPFHGLLRTVALNLIRDRWRKTRGIRRLTPEVEVFPTSDPTDHVADRDLVARALNLLPQDQRQVIELRILQGLSTAETARRMGRTEAAVRTLQYRAVQALREVLS
jgi:RNA polymerase sigma-70 factor (ECF subfamily)